MSYYSLLKQLAQEDPEIAKLLTKAQESPQQYSLLGNPSESVPAQEKYGVYLDKTSEQPNQTAGNIGMWGTAMSSVAQTLPMIMQMMKPTGGFAPSGRGSSRSNIVTPNIYPQGQNRYRSLLAMYLRK